MLPGCTNPNAHLLHDNDISRYFDSENYASLDYIKRRQRTVYGPGSDEACPPANKSIDRNFASRCEDKYEKAGEKPSLKFRRFGLRRPLSPSLTLDEIREQSICHEEFADKPYSTVMSRSGPMQYSNCFPLLMARSSDAEDKDNTKVQTETRRMSTVTTDYNTGKIKLIGVSSEENIKLSVFPILHKDLSSDTEDEEDGTSDVSEEDDVFQTEPTHPIPIYRRMTISTPSNTDMQVSRWNPGRRRTSVANGIKFGSKNVAKLMGKQGPRVTRRRSMDSNAISAEHFRALQIIRERMRNSTVDEEDEDDDDGPLTEEDEYHLKHAASTMLHLDKNLNTLEKFLSKIESTLDKDDSSSSGVFTGNKLGELSTFSPAENRSASNETSSESDDDEATFW